MKQRTVQCAVAAVVAIALMAPSAHAGGRRAEIAFSSNRDGSAQIYVMNADGSSQTRVTNSFPDDDTQPSWSPDGRTIVFTRGHGYQSSALVQSSLVAVATTTGTERVLVDDPGVNFRPAFSPNGNWIVYVHGPRTANNGPFDLWLMRADGSSRHALTASGDVTQPSWSPDGSSIVVNRGSSLAIVSVTDGTIRPLPPPPVGADYTPSWSPGTRIVFSSTRDGGGKQIYVMDPDGSNVQRLVRDGAEDKYPSWSPDGRRIIYSRSTVPCTTTGGECSLTQLGGFEIFEMNADGSHQQQLTSNVVPETQFGDGYPTFRPNDRPTRSR
jgi:TolB protein